MHFKLNEYKHLSLEERERYYALKEQGLSLREIGRRLGRSHSTFVREKRNAKYGAVYIPCKTQIKADKRGIKQRTKAPLKEPLIFLYVREHLRKPFYWTPEQISGRLKLDHPGKSITLETIYAYIYVRKNRRFKLWEYLTLGRKKRMKKTGRTVHRESRIKGAVSIDLRSEEVSLRQTPGHYETDNLGGKVTDKTALSVTAERLARLVLLSKLKNRSANVKSKALIKRLLPFPQKLRKTVTEDNGLENTNHQQITDTLVMNVFFCHSYASWEKGTVENSNLRIRRFIPKGTSIDTVSSKKIKQIEIIMNSTPRKCLGYLTPYERMDQLQKGIT